MSDVRLIADSGATKAEWCLVGGRRRRTFLTQGISPYFLDAPQIRELLRKELLPSLGGARIDAVHYYGTGCNAKANAKLVADALKPLFPGASVTVNNDLLGAARALCGREKGIACILGTGSNSCYYNGLRIVRNSPGLGYVLGDEGSGAYLGRKVVQHYLYGRFDEVLRARFDAMFVTTSAEILDNVYKKPLPNRYLASFTRFLAENRGHDTVEGIIEAGLDDFFVQHAIRYPESRRLPVHFVGGVAHGFRDVVLALCRRHGLKAGRILKNPMEGLVAYHR